MEYRIISELGNREVNEDNAKYEKFGNVHCFIVCDGLGGHGRGEVASQMVIDSILSYFHKNPDFTEKGISEALEKAQIDLLNKQIELRAKNELKTTCVLLIIADDHVIWGHIGDSRLYCFNKNKISYRTLDHSVPQMLVLAGDIKEKQIRLHPDRNRLLRVMGSEWGEQKYEISKPISITKCQAFLLCTDGFWEYIEEKAMCKLLKKSSSAESWLNSMINEVHINGSGADMDNHTAIVVTV